jgi:acetoacetyl-CoA synthetase
MLNTPEALWTPSSDFIENSNLKNYEHWLTDNKGLSFKGYHALWHWSVTNIDAFWESLWQYFEIINHTKHYSAVSAGRMPETKWFEGAELNYTEHIFLQNAQNSLPCSVRCFHRSKRTLA